MNVLLLSPYPEKIRARIEIFDNVVTSENKIGHELICENQIDFIVAYGYRHILQPQLLAAVNGKAVNLHISLLPWNRGAHPNVWSVVEETPKGITIHKIDAGIDTGDIFVQREVDFSDWITLRESYQSLHEELVELFSNAWPEIRAGEVTAMPQDPKEGTAHRSEELARLWPLLPDGWDTRLKDVPRFNTEFLYRG